MDKRAFDRITVDMDVHFAFCSRDQRGKVVNISEKGMYIITDDVCFPADPELVIVIENNSEVHHVPVSLRRVDISPDSLDGIGVEVLHLTDEYAGFVGHLRSRT
jgi:hypothetical protein